MEKPKRMAWKRPLFVAGLLYLAARPALDFNLGSDSPFSRYIARPIMNLALDGAYGTEQQYQEHLDQDRRVIANEGRPIVARIFTFPFSPRYEDFKDNSNEK